MTIIIDLNLDQPRVETLRFDSAPLDTLMVISAQQERRPAPHATPPAETRSQHATPTTYSGDEEITWEDAEWQ